MTSPNDPTDLPACMDYSAYSLDDLWEMVSPPDNLSQSQIASWYEMAILCGDQADNLARALTKLAEFWPPRPGSAAETFASLVEGLVASMREDASNAREMSWSLSGIVTELDSAKAQMQDLMDLRAHYEQLPSGASRPAQLSQLMPSTSHQEFAPIGWQDDLRAQARAIMSSTDGKIENITATMPAFTIYSLTPGRDDQDPPARSNGATSTVPVHPLKNQLPSGLPSHVQWRAARDPSDTSPFLAGPLLPAGSQPTLQESTHASWITTPDGIMASRVVASVADRTTEPVGLLPSIGATQRGSDSQPQSTEPVEPQSIGEAPAARTPMNGSMIAPGGAARPSAAASRPGVRPGGRAALWASQRQRKKADPTDPWAVRQGGPAVVEPPTDPVDHDPGPGVIGIDR